MAARDKVPARLRRKVSSIVSAVLEKKGERLTIMDVRSICSYTDYILVCSGSSTRQVQTIARHVEESLKKKGIKPLGVEGMREGNWILLDYNDVILHVFYEPVRVFYGIEDIYLDAPRYDVPEEDEEAIERLGRKLFAS